MDNSADEYSKINSEDSRSPDFKLRVEDIASGLASFFNNQMFTDFTIVVGDEKIKVHKFALALASPVFKRMLMSDCIESTKGEVVIKDCENDVLMQMLEFIYTGKAPKIKEMANKLITISEKYDLQILKRKCEKVLVPSLCVDNAIEMLVLGDRNNAKHLETATIDFIKKHYNEVRETDAWEILQEQHSSLHVKITDSLANYLPSKKSKPNEI